MVETRRVRRGAVRPGDIEMATVMTKTALLSKAEAGEAGAASSDPGAGAGGDASADRAEPLSTSRRPSTLSGGASSLPPEGLPRWGLITIAVVFFGMALVIGGLLYFSGDSHSFVPALEPSRLLGTWRNLRGDEYVIDGTEEGTEVKQKVNSGYKSVGHLSFPTRSTGDSLFRVKFKHKDKEGDNEAGKETKSYIVAYFGEDKAKHEVTYISWCFHGPVADYDVWIHVDRTKAAREEMRTALDGTWHAMDAFEMKWREAKVVRKDGLQVWQEEGAPESPIGLSADGKLFDIQADGMRLTWDGYVLIYPLDTVQTQTILWKNPGEDPRSHPVQWQKAPPQAAGIGALLAAPPL